MDLAAVIFGLVIFSLVMAIFINMLFTMPVLPLDEAAVFLMQSPCHYEEGKNEILLHGPLTRQKAKSVTRRCTTNEEGQAYFDELVRSGLTAPAVHEGTIVGSR